MNKKGFTLIELMVVIAIVGTLSSVLVPSISNLTDKANVAKIVAAVDSLKTASNAHYMDTGAYAYEYAAPWYTNPAQHRLSLDPGTNGWNGPYLDVPLSRSDNPYKNRIWLYANTNGWPTSSGGAGFDLTGNGIIDVTGAGNHVVFYAIRANTAQMINVLVDGDGEANPFNQGKFEQRSNYYGAFYITGGR